MSSLYYPLLYRLDGRDAFLLWCSNDHDGVMAQDGRILSFSSDAALRRFAARHRISLEDEAPTLHDLDAVHTWVGEPRGDTIDCALLLNAWNLFADIARSLPGSGADFSELDRAHDTVYEKLFRGNNLPAVTPEGERYDPEWSYEEVAALTRLLECGLHLLRAVRKEVAA